ncbi:MULTISPECIES: hypothetical protein [unclassified Blastococcus]
MSAGRVVAVRTTPSVVPPMEESNEAEPEQLATARRQRDADRRLVPGLDVTVTVPDASPRGSETPYAG